MEYSKIEEVNKRLKPMEIKGKSYNTVNQRILAFRELCPDGSITTEILSLNDGVVLMKATITDELGRVIATGHAQEKESSSYINKTSFIENAETSCVGRALGMLGIGAVDSLASFEEVANAIANQNADADLEAMTKDLKESSSYINKTSFIENAETSCVGRALGMLGIGAVDSLASFEEVANAIANQNADADLEAMTKDLKELYEKAGGKNFNKWADSVGGVSSENYPKMKATLLKQINDKESK